MRACTFSFVMSNFSTPNSSLNALVRLIDRLDRHDVEGDAEVLGERARVVDRALRRELRRHGDAGDVLRAERFDGDRRGDGGVDAAGEADDDVLEAALADVVAQPEDQRARRSPLPRESPDRLAALAVQLDERRVLLERGRAEDRLAGASITIDEPSKSSSSLPPTWFT
jgi:hypothetical protein